MHLLCVSTPLGPPYPAPHLVMTSTRVAVRARTASGLGTSVK
jgi:hypothetical protein